MLRSSAGSRLSRYAFCSSLIAVWVAAFFRDPVRSGPRGGKADGGSGAGADDAVEQQHAAVQRHQIAADRKTETDSLPGLRAHVITAPGSLIL